MRKAAAPDCTMASGTQTCGGDYPTNTGEPWSTDFEDDRVCSPCQCGFGSHACLNPGTIQLYPQPNCQGNPISLGGGQDGDDCNLAFTPQSGRIAGTPAANTCEPSAYPNGEAKPSDTNTICCH